MASELQEGNQQNDHEEPQKNDTSTLFSKIKDFALKNVVLLLILIVLIVYYFMKNNKSNELSTEPFTTSPEF